MKLELLRPVKPYYVNQIFGVDPTTYGQFGLKGHNGIDMRAYHGQPIFASHDGFATYEIDNNQGHGVTVMSVQTYDYNGGQACAKTIYWHMCDPVKEPKFKSPIPMTGTFVKTGDLLGYANSTGFSSGDHLHYGLKFGRLDAFGRWVNVDQDNGYLGSVDPAPYLSTGYAQDVHIVGLLRQIVSLYQQLIASLKPKK